MNLEDNTSQPTEQEQLEARVLAMLLGQSDAVERATVEALLAENNELQVYREQTESRLGLLDEASRDKASLEAEPLQLDSDRRAELAKLLTGEETSSGIEQESAVVPFSPPSKTIKGRQQKWTGFLALGAAAAIIVFIGIMARFALVDQGEENMAQVDERSPQSLVTIKSKERATRRGSANRLVEKALQKKPRRPDGFNEITETASLDQIQEDPGVQLDELDQLLPNLKIAAAESSKDILNKRIAKEITAINDSNLFDEDSRSSQPKNALRGRFASNGFAFAGETGGGGFAPASSDRLRVRDSASASSALPAPSEPAEQSGPKALLTNAEPAPFPTAPAAEPENAEVDSASTLRNFARSVEKLDSGKKSEGVADKEPTGGNPHVKELGKEDLDADGTKENRPSLGRGKYSEERKLLLSKTTSDATADSEVEGQTISGFTDASHTSEDKPKGLVTKPASAHVGTDSGTVSPPLPTPPHSEISTEDQVISTFSPKVREVSFRLAENSLKQGQWPTKSTIRSEEFVNAFDYRSTKHTRGESLAFSMERARHPFIKDREILRVALKAIAKEKNTTPLNLVIVLDNSVSMKGVHSSGLVNKTLQELAKHLTGSDRVSLVTFAQQPKLRLDNLPGNELKSSLAKISKLIPEEGTNLEKALEFGFAEAHMRYFQKGSNHVLLLSDGAANLGERVPRALRAMVDKHRAHGVVLDCIGLGSTGYVDHMLDSISGNGHYGFLDEVSKLDDAFGRKLAGILRPRVAELKVQVEFNPDRVELYRQVGFEKDQLEKQYFDEKLIGGTAIANGESVNALYVVKLNPKGKGDLGALRVRYKDLKTGDLEKREWKLAYNRKAPAFLHASASMRLAVHSATFAEWLADSPHGAGFVIDQAIGELQVISKDLPDQASIDRLREMMMRSRSISR